MGQRQNSESPMGVTFRKLLGPFPDTDFGSEVSVKAMIQERLSQLKGFMQEQCMCIFSLEIEVAPEKLYFFS